MMMGDKKSILRKKAMDAMMKDGPTIAIKIAKKSMPMGEGEESMEEKSPMEKMMAMHGEGEEGEEIESAENKEGGFISMMVSPEEKQMLEKMRKG